MAFKEELQYWRKHYSLHDWFMGHCFAEQDGGYSRRELWQVYSLYGFRR